MKKKYIVSKKSVIYAQKYLVLITTIEKIIKSEIIVVTQENIEELLVIFAIQNAKPKIIFCRKSLLSYIRLSFHNQRASRRIWRLISIPIKKELDTGKIITYKIKLIDSVRIMSGPLSSLVDNLSEGLHNYNCTNFESCIDYISTKHNQLILKCIECSINHKKHFNKDLIKRLKNTYEFCDRDISKFILLLRKEIYPYEYMDSWERFDEELLHDKEIFYCSSNMEEIADDDYSHDKNVGYYPDFFVQRDILLLADTF